MKNKENKSLNNLSKRDPLDTFFNLGHKATGNNPTRKALYDYLLYWIVFLAFVGIAITYYYNYFFGGASISTLLWALVVTAFGWFNYWALGSFRMVYQNMKQVEEKLKAIQTPKLELEKEVNKDVDDMLSEFSNDRRK